MESNVSVPANAAGPVEPTVDLQDGEKLIRYKGKWCVETADSANEKNEMFWKQLKVLHQNEKPTEDKDPMLLIQRGLDSARKPCGIAAVESSFSPLKMIQTAKRAALSYKKTCKLLYIYCNYRYLKNFR